MGCKDFAAGNRRFNLDGARLSAKVLHASAAHAVIRFYMPASGRIPSLDGLRAFSILLVLLAHLPGTGGFPAGAARAIDTVEPFLPVGTFGVRVFFVISGYLI